MDASSTDVEIFPAIICGGLGDFSHEALDNWDSPARVELALEKRLKQLCVPCEFVEVKPTVFFS